MRARGLFVTGTDTGVGKTVAAAAVLSVLRRGGRDAVPMKPVETGAGGPETAADLDFCLAAAGLAVTPEEYRLMAPCRLPLPASPHLAAREAGTRVEMSRLLGAFRRLLELHGLVIVEGAGGVLVPLDETTTMLDLMVAMELPVMLVARSGLGTINHTLLSLREIERAGLPVAGVVFCDSAPTVRGPIERDNVRIIPRMSGAPVVGHIPYLPDIAVRPPSPEAFFRACARHLPAAGALMARLEGAA
jgi:dethiobiotin synthetase